MFFKTYRNSLPQTLTVSGVIIGIAGASESSHAALLSWNNAAGGSAAIAGNWNPALVPAPADDLQFSLAASYATTFNASVAAADTHTYRTGTVTLTMTAPHTAAGGITIGDLNGDLATASLATGTWNSNGNVVIGDAAGSTGTLNVNDDDADFILAGVTTDLFVGNNGAGTLNVTGGGRVVVSDQLIGGSNATSTTNLTVSGFVAQAPFPVSSLEVLGTNASRLGQGGDATVNISNGALAQFGGDLVIANGSASASSVTVQGQGLITGARLNVAGDLLLGRNTSAGAAAGAATLNVNADGNVDVGDTLFVAGDPDGGTATLRLADEGSIVATSLNIGAGATLDLDGGTLDIDGGTLAFTNPNAQFNLGGVDDPIMTLTNNASANLAPTFALSARSLTVGTGAGAAAADFDVRAGADLTISGGGDVGLGQDPDDFGGMIIDGSGSSMTLGAASDLMVGVDGEGRFEAELGGNVVGDRLMIALNAGSSGFALFENAGTTAQFNSIFVGGTSNTAGGDGTLVVNQSAVLTMPGAGIPVHVWPTGLLDVTGGQLNGSVQCDGEIQLQDTGLMNGNLHLTGDLTGHPNLPGGPAVINGAVLSATGTTIRAIHGDLILGNEALTNGFVCALGSTIFTGANTITLHDADEAVVASVVLDGGTLAAPNGIEIQNNGSIDGTGTLTGDVFFLSGGGVITATGASGITINGMLSNNSGNIDGTKFTFNGPDGGWTGAGAINARAVFNADTVIDAIANMSIGLNVSDGVTFNAGSDLYVNDEIVTLVDSNGLGLPSITEVADGSVVCTQGLVLNNGRVLRGQGTINSPLLTVFGSVRPGDLDKAGVGELHLTGNLTVGGDGHAFFHIAGVPVIPGAPGLQPFDIIEADTVSLNGELHVNLLNGFIPPVGTVYTIIEGTSLISTFASSSLERPGLGKNWLVVYDTDFDDVKLIVNTCVADATHDGTVNVDDLVAVILDWGQSQGPCPPFVTGADINDSCAVDVDDLVGVILAWGDCP